MSAMGTSRMVPGLAGTAAGLPDLAAKRGRFSMDAVLKANELPRASGGVRFKM